ncbi:hypothetical protein NCS57_01477600 [Fusarium keratoplasticum]|uniref:Uncharacterized protein n=1 Tax=Fusarium keratoplasticum TaxID=1328300 RepID=A0ACC0QB94_9HYPO|nr:hypothetical protein NCS57_01477600 [Fusarium keratoplasticum]KAI8648658.1 hypothetical protein NCS57_01477600 [Fusarium keratoplasticum]
MKFAAVVAAFASVAAAAPSGVKASMACTPGTYACTSDAKGWQVCTIYGLSGNITGQPGNITGHFVFAGTCPSGTSCQFLQASKSPYCVPPGFKLPQGSSH